MGGCTFHNYATRERYPTPEQAFDGLTADSRYESGHSYSGEIGMKHDFRHIATVETREEATALANKLIEDSDPRIDDKWGPAGCITVQEPPGWLFFGWASS